MTSSDRQTLDNSSHKFNHNRRHVCNPCPNHASTKTRACTSCSLAGSCFMYTEWHTLSSYGACMEPQRLVITSQPDVQCSCHVTHYGVFSPDQRPLSYKPSHLCRVGDMSRLTTHALCSSHTTAAKLQQTGKKETLLLNALGLGKTELGLQVLDGYTGCARTCSWIYTEDALL